MSYEAFAEGLCWECLSRLEARADGWSVCPKCDRWFRRDGDEIVERIPIAEDFKGQPWNGVPGRVVMEDGSVRPLGVHLGVHPGSQVMPVDAKYFEMRTHA